MTIQLNDIVFDDFNLGRLADEETKLPRRESRSQEPGIPPDERLRRLETAGNTALDLALEHYALERDRVVTVGFAQRGSVTLATWLESPESRNAVSWSFIETLGRVTAFGNDAVRKRLTSLQPFAGEGVLDRYADAMIAALRGEVDQRAIGQVMEMAADRKATRYVAGFVLPAAQGLLALGAGDPQALQESLSAIVRHHKDEVKGDYRLDALRGFINAYGIFHVRLALERGIPLTIDSPYLPVWLVDLCRTTPPSAS